MENMTFPYFRDHILSIVATLSHDNFKEERQYAG